MVHVKGQDKARELQRRPTPTNVMDKFLLSSAAAPCKRARAADTSAMAASAFILDEACGEEATDEATTADSLRRRWKRFGPTHECRVVGFYGSSPHSPFAQFSNFWDAPFDFVLPAFVSHERRNAVLHVQWAEQAIMMCKAALFDDDATFDRLRAAETPHACKTLGRKVTPFVEEVWQEHVCAVAEAVIYQKFAQVPGLKALLLGTGGKLLAEASRTDRMWGIGLAQGDVRLAFPNAWRGANILGHALMHAREAFCAETEAPPSPAPTLMPAGRVFVGRRLYGGGGKFLDPSMEGFTTILCLTPSSAYGALSPYSLTDPEAYESVLDGYVDARKQVHVPVYCQALQTHPMFRDLQARVQGGENLLIVEVDGPHYESAGYYVEKYGHKACGPGSNFVRPNGTVEATQKNMTLLLNDEKHPFGHGYCLAMALLGKDTAWNGDYVPAVTAAPAASAGPAS